MPAWLEDGISRGLFRSWILWGIQDSISYLFRMANLNRFNTINIFKSLFYIQYIINKIKYIFVLKKLCFKWMFLMYEVVRLR